MPLNLTSPRPEIKKPSLRRNRKGLCFYGAFLKFENKILEEMGKRKTHPLTPSLGSREGKFKTRKVFLIKTRF